MAGNIKGHNNLHIFKTVALVVTVMVMFACCNDRLEFDGSRVKIYPVIDRKIETSVQTRAAVDTTLYSEYADNAQEGVTRQPLYAQAISFEAGSDLNTRANKDAQGVFSPIQNGGWRTGVDVESGYDYKLYVYSTVMPSPRDVEFSYVNGVASLTFDTLYLLTTNDPLVCVSASGALMPDNPDLTQYHAPTLNSGEFYIGTVTTVTDDGVDKKLKAFIALDHLYAKATLSIRIDGTYSQSRYVLIKDVEVFTPKGVLPGRHTYGFSNNLISPANQTASGDTAWINLFNGPTSTLQLAQNATCDTLTTDYQQLGYFYFLPMDPLQSMSLKVKYDICDKQGNVTRANMTAINNKVFNGINQKVAERGKNYKINITVSPTYLYQLSDGDLIFDSTFE